MHAVIFGLAAVGCMIAALAVGLGDLGDDASIGFRVKAVVGFLVPSAYFSYSTWKELRRERASRDRLEEHEKRKR